MARCTNNSMEKYEKLNVLGEGCYGSVYKCLDIKNNKYFAMKKMHMDDYHGLQWPLMELPERINQEVKLLQKLKHENIVVFHEVNLERRQINLIFEYLEMDLAQYLNRLPPKMLMHPLLMKSYLFQITKAVIYCQENHVVHRDINPANLLISPKGNIKLADFGLAVTLNVPCTHYSLLSKGTIWYLSPEVLLEAPSSSSYPHDIWSLGCVFAEMASRKVLFHGVLIHNQLNAIFKILTTPTEATWPYVTTYKNFNQLTKYTFNYLRSAIKYLDPCGFELLRCMLKCNPNKRFTATRVAAHPFLQNVNVSIKPYIEHLVDDVTDYDLGTKMVLF